MGTIEDVLDRCLEEIEDGKSLEEVLSRHPEHAPELRPLLETFAAIRAVPKPQPGAGALHGALVRAGKYIPDERRSWHFDLARFAVPRFLFSRAAAVVLAGFLAAGVSLAGASASALPGDLLYPVKLAAEKVRITLAVDPQGRAELRLAFSRERMEELAARYGRNGTIDDRVIAAMLEEARAALNGIAALPKEKRAALYAEAGRLNSSQKEVLRSIQPRASGRQKEYVEKAIATCDGREMRMRETTKDGGLCPWDGPSGCDWE